MCCHTTCIQHNLIVCGVLELQNFNNFIAFSSDRSMDFGDLKDDNQIQTKIQNLHESVAKIDRMLQLVTTNSDKLKSNLSLKEKTDHDLFMAYTLNTLYWIYLRTKGIDPNKDEVKNQLNRVKDYMIKAKQAHERNTLRPTIKQDVAARFIKHGISHSNKDEPAAKKRKTRD